MATETQDTTTANTTTTTETSNEQMVPKAELDRVLSDMHKFKTNFKEASEKLKTIEETKLRETNDWKTLAERREQEANEAKEEANRIKTSFVNGTKFSAVKEAAIKAGLVNHAVSDLELLDLNGIQIETTNTGKMQVLGADSFVNNLKTLKPHWFGATKTNVNSSTPGVTPGAGPVTKHDLLKMSLEAAKTQDYTAYKAALNTYRQQSK